MGQEPIPTVTMNRKIQEYRIHNDQKWDEVGNVQGTECEIHQSGRKNDQLKKARFILHGQVNCRHQL